MKLYAALAVTAFVCLFNLAGADDYDIALQSEKVYCQNVIDGIHPDYDQLAQKGHCEKWR